MDTEMQTVSSSASSLLWGVLNDNVFPTMGREIQGPYQVRLEIS